jgi:DNA-binding LacI/PurR family transcriptional regulator
MALPLSNTLDRRSTSQQLADVLRQDLLARGKPGQRVASIRELARKYSVSTTIVNQAMTILAGQGLVKAHHGRGTFLTDTPDQRHVGVLLELDISSPYTAYSFRRAVQVALRLLRERGWEAQLYTGRLTPDHDAGPHVPAHLDIETVCPEFYQALTHGRLCGVIAVASPPQARWFDLLRQQGVPAVGNPDFYPCGAEVDYPAMAREGVRYLAHCGRERIGLIQWRANDGLDSSAERAWSTFEQTMAEAGLTVDPAWVRYDLSPARPGSGWSAFRELWAARRDSKPDGLLVLDDRLMREVAMGILQTGLKVPEQLLVVSHGARGSGIAYPFPVAEMVVDPDAMAQAKVDILTELMAGRPLHSRVVQVPMSWRVPPELAAAGLVPQEIPGRRPLAATAGEPAHSGSSVPIS